ncbi:uncharacterized protein BO97DRAFT_155456 [Aspergillus homomorphus CBS 101889]|uniref:Uncharacterized protein n=1 Tax=Aspergillus homomorphus (strain CBS 101889) TaxID=1450537 RepID=A0A395HR03_ASPHC|nr:hypothetical protein BO97DRAFT_155456 [Aspergillus homomorphus CBS 101889]RAL09853.1 hypothetical protein BO97DRAFT_155456 [Aspergillus homomorphus CBS 101889]
MSVSISGLLTLLLLAIISIPLVITAWITISLSLLALIFRLLIVYLELCFAIIANFFVIRTATNISLLNLSASEPSTPAAITPKRLSVDHGATKPLPTVISQHHSHHLAHSLSRAQNKRPSYVTRTNSASTSTSSDQQGGGSPTRIQRESNGHGHPGAHHLPSPAPGLLSLISGDSGRDFEGLGGWRSPSSTARYAGHLSGTASPSPNGTIREDSNNNNNNDCGEDDTDGDDERAWLSINQRLELPSQPLTLRSNSSCTSELFDPSSSPIFWRQRRPSQEYPHAHRQRHHHRSATTSSLQASKPSTSSLSLSLSSRPDPGSTEPRSLRAALSPSSSIQQLPPTFTEPVPGDGAARTPMTVMNGHSSGASAASAVVDGPPGGGGGGGGYFNAKPVSRASSSASTTPNLEGGQSPRPPGKSMVHYTTGLRYRRRSISGPNSGIQFLRS